MSKYLISRQLFLSAKHFDIGGVLFGGGMASIATYKSPLFLLKLMGIEW